MYKVFVLAAIIAVTPLSQQDSKSNSIDVSSKAGFHFTLKKPSPANPFENKKTDVVDTAALKQTDWYSTVLKNIEASEYEIKKEGETNLFVAPNRQQQLTAAFNYNSFTLQPRDEKSHWKLGLLLNGIYANNKLIAAPNKKDLAVAGSNKITFRNNDFSTEYINSKEGVRENFIINKEPASKPKTISIKLKANKNWFVNKVHDKEIHFAKATATGYDKKIVYNSLKVWDTDNKSLDARFVVNEKHTAFEIEVNTEHAVYPITIDPISTNPVTTLNGINPGDYFGNSVSSAGDVNGDGYSDVIVGAPGVNANKGAIYIFQGSATGLASLPSTTLNGTATNGRFGGSVASAADVNKDGFSDVIVGAPGENSFTGAVYVYTGSAAGLNTSPVNTFNGVSAGDNFGNSVACAGDIDGDGYSDVVVGAFGVAINLGQIYTYRGSGTGLLISTTIPGLSGGGRFGWSVAGGGDVDGDGLSDVIVGAPNTSPNGTAYLFRGNSLGLSVTPATTLTGVASGDQFGYSVTGAGDINGDGYSDIVIGAIGVASGKGAAYTYLGSVTGLSTAISTTLTGVSAGDQFGISVSCAGDINGDGFADVLVGAEVVATSTGAAYLFQGSTVGLSVTPSFTRSGLSLNSSFGYCVASAGDVNGDGYSDIVIGAPNFSANTGAAYTYHGSSDGLSANQVRIVSPLNQSLAGIGNCVASAGDVNGDGYSDVIIGAYGYDDVGSIDEGRAWVYYGSAAGLSALPDVVLDDANQAGASFGYSVAGAGDVNGDGYSDVIVGAYLYSGGNTNEGRAWVHYGGPAGLSVTANRILDDANQNGAGFGNSVASAGDVNGDGYDDVIVGARFYDDVGSVDEGKAWVYYGSVAGLSASPSVVLDDANQAGANFGVYVAGAGDVNGDGYSDLIVGAHLYTGGNTNEGRAWVHYGSASGLSVAANRVLDDANQNNAGFGIRVSGAGDVNGDGLGDVIVSAIFYDGGKGRAWVYYGHAITGLSATPDVVLNNNSGSAPDYMGYSIATAGDVNGDGYGDVIVGVPQHSFTFTQDGGAFVYYGSASGLSSTPGLILHDAIEDNEFFGLSSASAGDVNSDGYSDVIVGADHGSFASTAGGKVYVHNGNDSVTNKRNNLRIYNTDLVTPVNSSNFTLGNFGAGLFARSFLGRGKGKLVWETRLNYNAYSGTPITNSTFFTAQQAGYTDLGLTGTELKNIITKLGGSSKYTKLRARVKYNLATALTGQVYGPWRNVSSVIDGNKLGALPINLISFDAKWVIKGNTAQLNFTTDKENSTCCFEIEKSKDGFNFISIGTVIAKNSGGLQSYVFNDNAAVDKEQFYRLKIKGDNGQVEYSNIQHLQNNSATEILVFPNPTTDVLYLQLNKAYDKMNVRVINSSGQTVKQFNGLTVVNQTLQIPVSNLASGNYWLHLQAGTEKQVLQFVKQ